MLRIFQAISLQKINLDNLKKNIILGNGGRQSNKTKPMIHKLSVSLEELYNGKVGQQI